MTAPTANTVRFIIKRVGTCPEGAVTGIDYLTLDVDLPELVAALKNPHGYEQRSLLGVEVLA